MQWSEVRELFPDQFEFGGRIEVLHQTNILRNKNSLYNIFRIGLTYPNG